jgi:type II secretory pathway pseudopilin PulG
MAGDFFFRSLFAMNSRSARAGVTLIELIIFIAIMGMVIAVALPLLFASTENRLLQQTMATVEQNGTQVIQNAGIYIRHAERVLSPAMGQTGSLLVLQTNSGSTHPTIIGFLSGSILIVQRATKEVISSPQVAIQDFIVRNTSTSPENQSVTISFRVSRTIRLEMPHSYAQYFESTFTLFPDDIEDGGCECMPPVCASDNRYAWQVCDGSNCLSASAQIKCP